MILIIQHVEIEGPGTLGHFLKNADWEVKTVELYNGDILPSLDDCEAIISLGGSMNVYEEDKYPFLGLEDEFLKGAIEKNIPTLGICLGAQLLAKCMDAEVKRAEQEEVGWYKVKLTKEAYRDSLFKGLPDSLDVFQWHEDMFDIPKGAVLLATSEGPCRNQAMRIGGCAWGLQFHPEITCQMIEDWVDYYPIDLDKEKLVYGYIRRKDRYEKQAQMFYINFANVILKSAKKVSS